METDAPRPEGDPLVQLRHPDGCVSRFSAETRYSLIEHPDGLEPTIVLEQGPSWHYCVPGDLTHEIQLPAGVLEIGGATALVVCHGAEPSLVAAVTGDVVLGAPDGSTLRVPESAVGLISADHLEIVPELSLGDLVGPGWLETNLALDLHATEPDAPAVAEAAAAEPDAPVEAVAAEPPPTPVPPSTQPPPDAGETPAAPRAGPRRLALPWLLTGFAMVAALVTAAVASVEAPNQGPVPPSAAFRTPASTGSGAGGRLAGAPGTIAAVPVGPAPGASTVPAPLPTTAVPGGAPAVGVPATPPKSSPATAKPSPPPYVAPAPVVAATGCRRQGDTLSMTGNATGRSGRATRIEIVAQFVNSSGQTVAEADSFVTVPGYGSVGWTASTSSGSAGAVVGCHLRGYRIVG